MRAATIVRLYVLFASVMLIFIMAALVQAQDVPPPTAEPDIVDAFLEQYGAFLTLHVAVLAAALVIGIDQIKSLILEPINAQFGFSKDSPQYKWVFRLARLILTTYAYFNVWGGVPETVRYVPMWATLNYYAVASIAILHIVGFEEFGHLAAEWLQTAVKLKKALKPGTLVNVPSAQTVNVNTAKS